MGRLATIRRFDRVTGVARFMKEFIGRNLRSIYPLWIRQKIYFHLLAHSSDWPAQTNEDLALEFAPTRMPALLKTDLMHRQIAWTGFYDLELSRRMAALARAGGVLVDVGANIGYFTCLWAATRADNRVYAFEPSATVFQMLVANIVAARLRSSVKTFEFALSKEEAIVEFDSGPSDQSGWGGITSKRCSTTVRVETKKLDDVMPVDVMIDVLKIDTEGADAWVLDGAERLLRSRRIRHIFFEQNLPRMDNLGIPHDAPFRTLQSCGYKVDEIGRHAEMFYARPA